jgi:hypothetical protein
LESDPLARNSLRIFWGVAVVVLTAAALRAQAPLGKAADNHIYAQTLVNELMASRTDLIIVGVHARAPGATDSTKIATNEDKIGRKDEPDDLMVSDEQKIILSPGLHGKNRFQVLIPMKDASGNIIGALGLVFKFQEGDDPVDFLQKGTAIRDSLAKRIPNLAKLFKPTPGKS